MCRLQRFYRYQMTPFNVSAIQNTKCTWKLDAETMFDIHFWHCDDVGSKIRNNSSILPMPMALVSTKWMVCLGANLITFGKIVHIRTHIDDATIKLAAIKIVSQIGKRVDDWLALARMHYVRMELNCVGAVGTWRFNKFNRFRSIWTVIVKAWMPDRLAILCATFAQLLMCFHLSDLCLSSI